MYSYPYSLEREATNKGRSYLVFHYEYSYEYDRTLWRGQAKANERIDLHK
jgi:hypothetical protein